MVMVMPTFGPHVSVSLLVGVATILRTLAVTGRENEELLEAAGRLMMLDFWESLVSTYFHKLVILNFGLNVVFLLSRLIQYAFLGPLRETETQNLGTKLRNYIMMRIVFVGAVMREHAESEMFVWFIWLTLVGVVKMFAALCLDRVKYLTLAVHTQTSDILRVAALILLVLVANISLINLCVFVFGCWNDCQPGGLSLVILLLFENVTIMVDTFQAGSRLAVDLYSMSEGSCELRSLFVFYSEHACELGVHLLTFLHFMHVWCIHAIAFSLTDLLLFVHTRNIIKNVFAKLLSLKRFATMDAHFVDATAEELKDADDSCSICRETMRSAKKLPCGHVFHAICLRSWLEHSETCPNCRRPVYPPAVKEPRTQGVNGAADGIPEAGANAAAAAAAAGAAPNTDNPQQPEVETNVLDDPSEGRGAAAEAQNVREDQVWRWQSWNLLSWMPRLSIEVVRHTVDSHGGWGADEHVSSEMIEQVLEVLPHLSRRTVENDLRLTRGDVQMTILRGLEGFIIGSGEPPGAEEPRQSNQAGGEVPGPGEPQQGAASQVGGTGIDEPQSGVTDFNKPRDQQEDASQGRQEDSASRGEGGGEQGAAFASQVDGDVQQDVSSSLVMGNNQQDAGRDLEVPVFNIR